jgi:hypothetical protein
MVALRALVAVVLLSIGLVTADAAPAAAQQAPQVLVYPFKLTDGEPTAIVAQGFPSGYSDLVQCSGAVRDAVDQARSLCGLISVLAAPGVPAEFTPWTARATVTTSDGSQQIDCRTEPSGCVAGVITVADPAHPEVVLASAFTHVSYTNVLDATSYRGLTDGDTTSVTGRYMTAGDWVLAQCDRAVVDDVSLGGVLTHCAAAPTTRTVTVDGSTLDTTIEAQATITRILGGTTDCAAAPTPTSSGWSASSRTGRSAPT